MTDQEKIVLLTERIQILETQLSAAKEKISTLISNKGWDDENRRHELEKERLRGWEHMGS